uniref:Neurochondrin n=1 Tax=Pundamilia nyererei TaxID=303518 RepID=A0A3B4F082_9CICH
RHCYKCPDGGGEGGGGSEGDVKGGLTDAQRGVLEKCVHALKHAKNDSQTLAALLLISRLCPASELDKPTLRRIFEAVGLNLPARLLVTAVRGDENSGLPPDELLSLGTALLAALSTEPDMASSPQLLTTIPLLLGILANGPVFNQQKREARDLDAALAADCYLVLTVVCALPRGPEQLLSRGAISALCQAVELNQTLSHEKGLTLLGSLLSGRNKDKAWSKHTPELLSLLVRLSKDFCESTDETRLGMCGQLAQFLPPAGVAVESEELKAVVGRLWEILRPMVQAKLTPRHIGSILVLSACLLDLYGWEMAGPPKFCCLLVNRACVEVRMGLEELPGNDLTPEVQHTITGCYRIMEAAIEQACSPGVPQAAAPSQSSIATLSLQQSRNMIIYLKRKFKLTKLLPFLINYTRSHLQGGILEHSLADWMVKMSIGEDRGAWTGREALRYLLPALCHLSAEEVPRKVLLDVDTPALLVDFLSQSWTFLRGKTSVASTRDPSMETACSALLNFTVTEPERVRKDSCFRSLEALLSEALPLLVNKPRLLVLTANCCTLGLMIGRLKEGGESVEAGQRRFLSSALRFLRSALDSSSSPGPAKVSLSWEDSWDDAAELWRLSLQALGGCARAQPSITTLIREEGWLRHMLAMLHQCSALPDQLTQDALQEKRCTL